MGNSQWKRGTKMSKKPKKRIRPRQNCWEFKECGRGPGGAHVAGKEACPAAEDTSLDGLNFGTNGGRICWAVAGTFCGEGEPIGEFAAMMLSCMDCDFFKKVLAEEGSANFELIIPRLKYRSQCR